MCDSLSGLDFKDFRDVDDFDEKLARFLDDLNEELKYWRGYEMKNGERRIRYPMAGLACLDGEEIVAISYFVVPKKLSPRWIYDKLFRPKGLEYGVVVKKAYQRRGIANQLSNLKLDILQELGYTQYWFRVDSDNIPSMQLSSNYTRKMKGEIWKKTDKQVYFTVNINRDFRKNNRTEWTLSKLKT
jgi:GNAT superfamily N-acetyltransferase